MSWCAFYHNVYNHPERPSDFVIDDDIELDKWLLIQKKEAKKSRSSDGKTRESFSAKENAFEF